MAPLFLWHAVNVADRREFVRGKNKRRHVLHSMDSIPSFFLKFVTIDNRLSQHFQLQTNEAMVEECRNNCSQKQFITDFQIILRSTSINYYRGRNINHAPESVCVQAVFCLFNQRSLLRAHTRTPSLCTFKSRGLFSFS